MALLILACAGLQFEQDRPFCCNGTVFPLTGYRGCCGSFGLTTATAVRCCRGVAYEVYSRTDGLLGCCNQQAVYKTATHICCSEDGVHDRQIKDACCNGIGYNTATYGCCANQMFHPETHHCCGSEIRNVTQSC